MAVRHTGNRNQHELDFALDADYEVTESLKDELSRLDANAGVDALSYLI